jgi:putative phosphoribosyl transferase
MFRDSREAGMLLADKMKNHTDKSIVLAIPRGGVPVALQVANKLNALFDVIVVRKIPIPLEPEAGYGAVTDDGTVVLNEDMVNSLGLSKGQIAIRVAEVKKEIERRRSIYKKEKRLQSFKDKVVILV